MQVVNGRMVVVFGLSGLSNEAAVTATDEPTSAYRHRAVKSGLSAASNEAVVGSA